MVAYTNPAMANAEMRVPTGDTVEEEQWIGQWLNSVKDEVVLTSEKEDLSNIMKEPICHKY